MPAIQYPYQNLSLKNIKGEKWEDIPGLEGYYIISNYGRVKRLEYEMQYINGAIYIKEEKIIKSQVIKQPNHYKRDHTFFLTNRVMVNGRRHNYTVARLVYYCFVARFDVADQNIVIVCKDEDNFNICPSNLQKLTRAQKQQRSIERGRFSSPLLKLDTDTRAGIRKTIVKKLSKQVTQYTLTGTKIKTFHSMIAAQAATGILSASIGQAASGHNITAGGYVWQFGKEKKIDIKSIREQRHKAHRREYGQKVSQYDFNGKRVACYPSLQDAEGATGANTTAIALVLKGTYKSAKGYFWQKGYGKHFIDLSGYAWGKASMAAARSKKVSQYTINGKFVQTFASLKEAAAYIGVISSTLSEACREHNRTCRGYKWQFKKKRPDTL